IDEIGRVLKRKTGQFFSVSFTAPHFRVPLLRDCLVDGHDDDDRSVMRLVDVGQLGDHFRHFWYHLSCDPRRQSTPVYCYEPPIVTARTRILEDGAEESIGDNFMN